MTSDSPQAQRNQRGLTRLPFRAKVKVTFPETGKTIIAESRDISGTGMLICANKKIPTNTKINVEFKEGRIDFSKLLTVVRTASSTEGTLLGLAAV